VAASKQIDQAKLVRDLSLTWFAGQAESEALLADLVAHWAREADSDADPGAVNAIQRGELEDAVRDRPPDARAAILRMLVLDRLISDLHARTYALGRAILDGETASAAAREDGLALLRETEALGARLRALDDPDASARLMPSLNDALMEALFAVEGKAMSPRLSRYDRDRRPAGL
jgi:hypothetical protein